MRGAVAVRHLGQAVSLSASTALLPPLQMQRAAATVAAPNRLATWHWQSSTTAARCSATPPPAHRTCTCASGVASWRAPMQPLLLTCTLPACWMSAQPQHARPCAARWLRVRAPAAALWLAAAAARPPGWASAWRTCGWQTTGAQPDAWQACALCVFARAASSALALAASCCTQVC